MSKQNFEDLYFDVNKFGGKKTIQSAYPELLAYKDIIKITSDEWKVAILISDVGSPFVKIKDTKQKLDEIFKVLDIDPTSSDLYYDFLNQRQSGVIDACTFLIEYQNNHEFSAWFELNRLYYELLRVISVPLNPEDVNYDKAFDRKMLLQVKLKTMQEDLRKYETNLFGTSSMKAAASYKSKKSRKLNWNEKYADNNQVE